jgi:cytochrome o ubiquinol oxidase subunit 3
MSSHEVSPDTHHDLYSKTVFGFWIYLITDFMLFATIFAAYAVLSGNHFGGPTQKMLFNLEYTTLQTLIFLVSTLAVGIGGVYAHRRVKWGTITFFLSALFLGAIFFYMELHEFSHLIEAGSGWDKNAFASAFFSLVGMFMLHLVFAFLWTIALLIPVFRSGVSGSSVRRLTCLKMFWQFLSIVWVFIYVIVYLVGIV